MSRADAVRRALRPARPRLDDRVRAVACAPLEVLDAYLLLVSVGQDSRLAGVTVAELRLPVTAAVSLVVHGDRVVAAGPGTVLRRGDQILVAVTHPDRAAVEHRLRAVGESGRLAGWYAGIRRGADRSRP